MNAGTGCIVFGVILLTMGLFLCIGGPLLVPMELETQMNKQIREQIIVDSTDSPGYGDWAGGYDKKQPYRVEFYMWNLTNADAIRKNASAVPIYESFGPYSYRRYRESRNVSFPDGGNQVQYNEYQQFIFDPAASKGNDTDLFINLNPVFLGAVGQAGNELGMLTAMSYVYIQNTIDWLTGPFIPLFTLLSSSPFLTQRMNATLVALETAHSKSDAYAIFLNAWANATQAPALGNWTGLLLSAPSGLPTAISVHSATQLFNSSETYSLLSTDTTAAWVWSQASHDQTSANFLTTLFLLTHSQLEVILTWRTKYFAEAFVYPYYMREYELTNISDLGWVQWFKGAPLDGQSTCDIWASQLNCQTQWEFFMVNEDDDTFTSWQFSKKVLDPRVGLLNGTISQAWLIAANSGQTNFSQWGLNEAQSGALLTYCASIGGTFGLSDLKDKFGPSGGLFRTKTVSEWAFNCHDYIQDILQPGGPSCGLMLNDTTYPPNLIYSGKDDVNKINTLIKWQGVEEVVGIWKDPVKVAGHTELGQFQPGISAGDSLYVFDDNFIRPLVMTWQTAYTVKNIDANRYYLDWGSCTAPSSTYYQKIAGIVNMTSYYEAPIFISLYDQVNVQNNTKPVIGLITNYTSEDQYNTVIDVEPLTGNIIQSYKRVQVNLYIDATLNLFMFSPFQNNPPASVFYPVARVAEVITISDDEASDLRDKLGVVPVFKRDAFYICLTVGPALIVGGIAMLVIGVRRRRLAYGYHVIQQQ